MKHLLILSLLFCSKNLMADSSNDQMTTQKEWQQHYSKKWKRIKSEVKAKSNLIKKEKSQAYKKSQKKLKDNINELNEKFMYLSLNHFEFSKKKRKRYKVKNKNTPYDRFVAELLINHIKASNYLYSGNEQDKKTRKLIKRDLLGAKDIQFLQTKYKDYVDSKFADEKEHQENIHTIKLKKNKKLADFKNLYSKPIPPPKSLGLDLKDIKSFHEYVLYMKGFDLAYQESSPYNEKLLALNLSLVDQRRETSLNYVDQIVEQARSVLEKESVVKNSNFLNEYVKNFKSMAGDRGLNKTLKSLKLNEEKLSLLNESYSLKFKEFVADYIKEVGPLKKKPSINSEKLLKFLEYLV